MLVASSHLDDVDWDDGVLTIRFQDGATYSYLDVPQGVFQELLAAPSKSAFFRENIKGVYQYSRVE